MKKHSLSILFISQKRFEDFSVVFILVFYTCFNFFLSHFRTFTCICFSADGSLLLAAGRSNFICMYSVAERIIVKKFKLTLNRSLDGVQVRTFLSIIDNCKFEIVLC